MKKQILDIINSVCGDNLFENKGNEKAAELIEKLFKNSQQTDFDRILAILRNRNEKVATMDKIDIVIKTKNKDFAIITCDDLLIYFDKKTNEFINFKSTK